MAKILIADDRPLNREFLVVLLGHRGHRLLEANDGAEALAIARAEHPELVIADVLMPTMDGYEFVRQLRADRSIAGTPVIFYTAHYHEREARALARGCGVSSVITKPSEPEAVLAAVDAALGGPAPETATRNLEEFDREHLRLLTDKLSEKSDALHASNARLSAMIELNLQLASELDLQGLLQTFGHAAREIIGARYAITGVLSGDGSRFRSLFTSGMDAETAAHLGAPDPKARTIRTVLLENRTIRLENRNGDPVALGPPRPTGTVLVVDDEPVARKFIREVLVSAGYSVVDAQDGREALQKIENTHIDLIITNLAMPEQDGIQTIRILRRKQSQINVIAMSGNFSPLQHGAQLLGAQAYISEPIQEKELFKLVARVLRGDGKV